MSKREIKLTLPGGNFFLSVGSEGGSISSNLHFDSLEEFLEAGGDAPSDPLDDCFNYGRYEGAIDSLESFVLAASEAGIDVQSEPFVIALQTTLDAIGNNL